VRNDRHVSDIASLVHESTDLLKLLEDIVDIFGEWRLRTSSIVKL
jgi:hypothetical protein